MFSGFRNVVENLAQPQPRPSRPQRAESQDLTPERPEHTRNSTSFDLSSVAHSTGHLAESAFSNLRKSLAAQRPFTVTSPTTDASARASPQPDRELKPVSKPTLEDRLRATFAIGDASASPSPGHSHASSPKPPPLSADSVLSPRSVPLPDSPIQTGNLDQTMLSHPLAELPELDPSESCEEKPLMNSASPQEPIVPQEAETSPLPSSEGPDVAKSDDSSKDTRYPEADIPLPLLSPVPTNLAASQSSHSLHVDESPQQSEEKEDSSSRLDSLERTYSGNPIFPVLHRFLTIRTPETSKTLEELRSAQAAINSVLAEFTPVASMLDVNGLRDHLQSLLLVQNVRISSKNRFM